MLDMEAAPGHVEAGVRAALLLRDTCTVDVRAAERL